MNFLRTALVLFLCSTASCVSYRISRVQTDSPIDADAFEFLEVGKTRLADAVERLGPPDRLDFVWDNEGEPHTRFEYAFQKGRSSDFVVQTPIEEIRNYNTGVRFFLLFLNVVGGGSVIPSELEQFDFLSSDSPDLGTGGRRLSDMKASRRGRASRLSILRGKQESGEADGEGVLRPFVPFNMAGAGVGRDLIRLEFGRGGILVLKEIREGAPETGLGDQIRDSALQ